MQDWVKKLFNEPATLGIMLPSAIVGLIAGITQGVVVKRHGGWGGLLRAMLTGVAVAVFVGLGIEDFIESETARLAIVGACAVISEEIWDGLHWFGSELRRDPLGFIVRLVNVARGRGVPPAGSAAESPSKDERGRP